MVNSSSVPARQRGVALITALLVVAIAATAAASMLSRQHLDIRRSQNLLAREQGWQYALAAEAVAIGLLARDRETNDIDGPSDAWARPLPPVTVRAATIRVAITDLQGRFNLNALANPDAGQGEYAAEALRNLLQNHRPEYQTGLEVAVADWLDRDLQPRFPDGAEDDFYTRLDPPYRPGNRLMASAGELQLVRGVDRATWLALRDQVTALPNSRLAINVNTAPPAVLRALAPEISPRDAEAVVKDREANGAWKDVSSFLSAHPVFARPELQPQWLTVASEYFLVQGRVELDRARVELYSIIHRPAGGEPAVVYRSRARP